MKLKASNILTAGVLIVSIATLGCGGSHKNRRSSEKKSEDVSKKTEEDGKSVSEEAKKSGEEAKKAAEQAKKGAELAKQETEKSVAQVIVKVDPSTTAEEAKVLAFLAGYEKVEVSADEAIASAKSEQTEIIKSKQPEVDTLSANVTTKTATIATLEENQVSLQKNLELAQEFKKENAELATRSEAKAKAAQELATSEETLGVENAKLASFKKILADQIAKIETLQKELDSSLTDAEELDEKTKELELTKGFKEETEKQIASTEKKLATQSTEVESAKATLAKAETAVAEQQAVLGNIKVEGEEAEIAAKITENTAAVVAAKEELVKVTASRDAARKDLSAANSRLAEIVAIEATYNRYFKPELTAPAAVEAAAPVEAKN